MYHELFDWIRKKDYITFLVGNQYFPLNKHQEEHKYHPLFDNKDMSKYIVIFYRIDFYIYKINFRKH